MSKPILILFILLCLSLFCLYLALKQLKKVSFAKRSLSSKYGKMVEQFMPFLERYPYDPSRFRFLGTPIDGIQFEDDKIIFVEFKVANSQLSASEERIKEMVKKRKVEWQEFKI
jgi:predicted Holliday junction resolvase-like endonuclease